MKVKRILVTTGLAILLFVGFVRVASCFVFIDEAQKQQRVRGTLSALAALEYEPLPADELALMRVAKRIPHREAEPGDIRVGEADAAVACFLAAYRMGGFERFVRFRFPGGITNLGGMVARRKLVSSPRLDDTVFRIPSPAASTRSPKPIVPVASFPRQPRVLWPGSTVLPSDDLGIIRLAYLRNNLGTEYTNYFAGLAVTHSTLVFLDSWRQAARHVNRVRTRYDCLGCIIANDDSVKGANSFPKEDRAGGFLVAELYVQQDAGDGPCPVLVTFHWNAERKVWEPISQSNCSVVGSSAILPTF